MYCLAKIGGNSKFNFESMTKKRSSEILADEKRKILLGKYQTRKIFHGVLNIFGNRGRNLKQGKMHHCLRGMDAPVDVYCRQIVPHDS